MKNNYLFKSIPLILSGLLATGAIVAINSVGKEAKETKAVSSTMIDRISTKTMYDENGTDDYSDYGDFVWDRLEDGKIKVNGNDYIYSTSPRSGGDYFLFEFKNNGKAVIDSISFPAAFIEYKNSSEAGTGTYTARVSKIDGWTTTTVATKTLTPTYVSTGVYRTDAFTIDNLASGMGDGYLRLTFSVKNKDNYSIYLSKFGVQYANSNTYFFTINGHYEYTVTFNKQSGTGGTNSVTAIVGDAMPTISVPTREKYNFLGYFDASEGGTKYYNADGTSAKNFDKDKNTTLYAQWALKGTTITLDKQGGTGGDDSVVGIKNQVLPEIDIPSLSGYIFNGYYSAATGEATQYYNENGVSSYTWTSEDESATFYARWTIKGAVQNVIDKINAIGTVSYPDSGTKIGDARDAYDNLALEDQGGVSNYATLTSAESKYAELRQQGIDNVESAINSIGVVTLDKENQIVEARAAYTALTQEQKNDVDPDVLAKLVAAEERLAELKAEKANADAVVTKINAIGVVKYPSSEKVINEARTAYIALNEEEKGFVTNLAVLEAAELELQKQKEEGADAAYDLIKAIGEVEDSEACKARIDAARAAYDALTADQKALIDPDAKDTLEAAEAQYKALHDKGQAAAVVAKIDAIGEVKYPDSKEAIEAARAAYDALDNKEQKDLVSNYQTLLDAEALYAQLELDATRHEIVDEQSGVKVATSDGTGIPTNINLKVEVKTDVKAEEGSTELDNIKKLLAGDEKISNVFEIKLIKTEGDVETEIQPSDIKEGMKLIITIDLPEGINVDELKILHIHNDSSVEFVEEFKVEENKVVFEVASLSELALVQKANAVLPGWAIALIVIGGVLLLLVVLYVLFMFVFNKWAVKNQKVVRAIKIRDTKGRAKVIVMPLCLTSVLESAVFKTKEEAEKYLGK